MTNRNDDTTHSKGDHARDFDDALCEAVDRHNERLDAGRYTLSGDGELSTLRYHEDGVQETLAHITPNGIVTVADYPEIGLHQDVLADLQKAIGTPDPNSLAHALDAAGYLVDRNGCSFSVWATPDDSCEAFKCGSWGRGRLSATAYDTCPDEVREIMHEHGFSVEPYRTATRLRAALDTDRMTVAVAESDRVIARREFDGTPLADVSADRQTMTVRPEAMTSEASDLKGAAHTLDLEVDRRQPTVAAAE